MVGFLAHLSPLLANFIFADLLAASGMPGTTPPGTIPLHGSLMLLDDETNELGLLQLSTRIEDSR